MGRYFRSQKAKPAYRALHDANLKLARHRRQALSDVFARLAKQRQDAPPFNKDRYLKHMRGTDEPRHFACMSFTKPELKSLHALCEIALGDNDVMGGRYVNVPNRSSIQKLAQVLEREFFRMSDTEVFFSQDNLIDTKNMLGIFCLDDRFLELYKERFEMRADIELCTVQAFLERFRDQINFDCVNDPNDLSLG